MSVFVTQDNVELFKFIKKHQPVDIKTIQSAFPNFDEAAGAEFRKAKYLKSPYRKDSQLLIQEEIYSLDTGAIKAIEDYYLQEKANFRSTVSFWLSIIATLISAIALFKQ